MEKSLQLVSFEQAKRLKKLGFDWEVYSSYYHLDKANFNYEGYAYEMDINRILPNNQNLEIKYKGYYSTPTIALALKWFRDEKCIMNTIGITRGTKSYYAGMYLDEKGFKETRYFDKYELAENALLNELLTILEK